MAKRTSSGQPSTENVRTLARLGTPAGLTADATRDICAGVNGLLHGCSTLSTDAPLGNCIEPGERSGVSVLANVLV